MSTNLKKHIFLKIRDFHNFFIKKIFLFSIRASITVEASVVLPLFLIFFINLVSSIEMIRLHNNLSIALYNTGNKMSYYGAFFTDEVRNLGKPGHTGGSGLIDESVGDVCFVDEEKESISNEGKLSSGNKLLQEIGDIAISHLYVKDQIVKYVGNEYLDKSPLTDGSNSFYFWESEILSDDDIIDIVLTYAVSTPIDIDGLLRFRMVNRYYSHLWNGYDVCQGRKG